MVISSLHLMIAEIAEMAIDFQRAVRTLRLAHLPNEPVQMRVGIHSGSVVSGIVGVTAPRYCVFGETVSVAAKMEASGQGEILLKGSRCLTSNLQLVAYTSAVRRGV